MSRELLKRVIAECSDEGSHSNITPKLYGAIAEYLEMPEPEPVAWMTTDQNDRKHVSLSMMPERIMKSWRVKSQEPLYTTPPDQSARIAEFEAKPGIGE